MKIPDEVVKGVKAKRKGYTPADALNSKHPPKANEYRKLLDEHNSTKRTFVSNIRLGRSKALPLREKPGYTYNRTPTKSVEELTERIRKTAADPVEFALIASGAARPSKVSKARHGIALRAAVREPMLNANPRIVAEALKATHLPQLISAGLYEQVIVKPVTRDAARAGRNSSFWGERRWGIHRPKYGRGYFIRYDMGGDSRVYGSMGELHSAIKRSGFQIIRR